MDHNAENGKLNEFRKSRLEAKKKAGLFDVFLCHNSTDKPIIREITRQLEEHGIRPWLDERDSRPGVPFRTEIEERIKNIPSAAVFVGNAGIGASPLTTSHLQPHLTVL